MIRKNLLSGIISLSFAVLAGCAQTDNFPAFPELQETNIVSSRANVKIKTDWFENLRPDLKAYYAPAKGKTGAALFDSLHQIISKNNKMTDYKSAKSFMYASVDNINVNGRPGVFDSYSYVFIQGSGGDGNSYKEKGDTNLDGRPNDFINCEHTWPQSFFEKKAPMVADIHHLFPTLSVPNEMRNHFPIGMAKGLVPYTTNGGAKLSLIDKTGKNRPLEELKRIISLPHEQKSTILDNEFTTSFEPPDRQKGNTARALLYFYLRYYNQGIKSGHFDEVDFWDSKVATYINWSEMADPVDEQEAKRHDAVYKRQNNRNPFIDIPQLGSLIGEEVLRKK